MPVAPKPRPYRRFLTSALHTRFVHAAGLALIWNLAVAGLASDWCSESQEQERWQRAHTDKATASLTSFLSIPSFFWAFFPLGPAGVKAGLFTLSSLFIFLLQIATFQIGKRCTPSNWTSIRTVLLSSSTYATLAWYVASAWWFCEVFIFTSPASAALAWTINGGYGAPDKLNERPIYLRYFFLQLGAMQAGLHILNDSSSLSWPVKKPERPRGEAEEGAKGTTMVVTMLGTLLGLVQPAATLSATASLTAPFLYTAFMRRSLWSWQVWWTKVFANIARSESEPPDGFYIGSIMGRAFIFGLLLALTWQLNIVLFQTFMLKEPTKDGKLLSSPSKDPNGTLLHGLNAKRELVKTFAFWELEIIARTDADRRKHIFADFERPNQGPIFSQMLNAALGVLKSIESRMMTLDPPPNAPTSTNGVQADNAQHHLPRLLPNAVPAKSQIYQPMNPAAGDSRAGRLVNYASHEAKLIGSSQNPWSPPLHKTKQLAIEYSSPTIKDLQSRAEAAQQSPLGRYLLTTPVRLIKSAVLGTPNSNPGLTISAVNSMTVMLVASLTEDTFGKAVHGVPLLVQALTTTIFATEGFVHKHTNGGFVSSSDANRLEEVVAIHEQLQTSLRELLSAFQIFLSDVGLSIRDLNDGRKAAETRELFRVIQPAEAPPGSPREPHDRSTRESSASGKKPEMQEVNEAQQRRQKEKQQQDQQARRRRSQQANEDTDIDRNRPGRLFSQLDRGSSYQASMRERRKSIGKGDVHDSNPLAAGSRRTNGSAGMSENPFRARDFSSLPAGGLQKRRVAKVQ